MIDTPAIEKLLGELDNGRGGLIGVEAATTIRALMEDNRRLRTVADTRKAELHRRNIAAIRSKGDA